MSDSFAYFMEMGTGKTLTTIGLMGVLYQRGLIQRALVVSPTTVMSVWPEEMTRFANYPWICEMLVGEKERRINALETLIRNPFPDLKLAIINYESVWRDGLKEALLHYHADIIICDESQRIKSHSAKQSKAMWELGDCAKYKIILSGTPVQNNCLDLWSQYRFLDKTIFGEYYTPFEKHYCVMHSVFRNRVLRTINQDELIRKEYSCAYRVTKEEALDLPEQTFETRYIDFTQKERHLYDTLAQDMITVLSSGETVTAASILTKFLRLQQLTGGFLASDAGGPPQQVSSAKLDTLKDIITDYVVEGGHKLVIFARFIAEVEAIKKLCTSLLSSGQRWVCIQGSVPKEQRGGIVQQFQTDKNTKIFIGQIDSVSLGITLTAASTTIYYSTTWNYASYSQSMSRTHRAGQHWPCHYIHLTVRKSIDSRILEALEAKEDISKGIVDTWRNYI